MVLFLVKLIKSYSFIDESIHLTVDILQSSFSVANRYLQSSLDRIEYVAQSYLDREQRLRSTKAYYISSDSFIVSLDIWVVFDELRMDSFSYSFWFSLSSHFIEHLQKIVLKLLHIHTHNAFILDDSSTEIFNNFKFYPYSISGHKTPSLTTRELHPIDIKLNSFTNKEEKTVMIQSSLVFLVYRVTIILSLRLFFESSKNLFFEILYLSILQLYCPNKFPLYCCCWWF